MIELSTFISSNFISEVPPVTPVKFASVSDTRISSDNDTKDSERTVAEINIEQDIYFVVVTGYITEFSANQKLDKARPSVIQLHKLSNALINNVFPLENGDILTTTMNGKGYRLAYEAANTARLDK